MHDMRVITVHGTLSLIVCR